MRQAVSALAGRSLRAASRSSRAASRGLCALAVVAGAMLWGQAAWAQGTVTLSGPSAALDEGAAAVFTATLSEVNTADVTVPYTLSGITAADVHGDLTGNSVVITRGNLSQPFTIYILVDGAGAETGESLTVTLGAPTIPDSNGMAATTGAPTLHATNSVTVAISDSSEASAPAVATTLAALADSAVNAAPGDTAAFRITISGFRAAQAQVEWEVITSGLAGGQTAAPVSMFTDSSLPAGSTTHQLPSGVMPVPAGHAQAADIRVRLHPLNRLSSGGTFHYKVRIRRTIQYTDAGVRPDTLPAVCTSSCPEADGSIVVPAASATLTVERAPAVQDPFVANPGSGGLSPNTGIDNQNAGGANSYTLREELTRAQERYLSLGGGSGRDGASSLLPGQAAVFRVDLCDDSFSSGCRALSATQTVTFEFEIGGSNSGYGADGALAGRDYRTPRVEAVAATAVNGGASWRATIAPGANGATIFVPLIDDDVAEPNETLNLSLVGTPTVAAADGGTVSLAASPNDRSLDYTIIGAEPAAVTSPAGSVALTGAHLGGARNGDRVRFTFTLTDDDTATGDTQTGADDTYRLWYALYAANTGDGDGFRFWTVLAGSNPANANDPAFFDLVGDPSASNRFRICDSGGRCETSPGDYLTRSVSGYGGAPKGYGWVILPQGETTATLDVVTNAHRSSSMAMSFFAVDAPPPSSGTLVSSVALPTYDYNTIAQVSVDGVGNEAAGRAFFHVDGGSNCTSAARAEGDTVQCRVNFRGAAPSPLDADNPLTVTWRLMGSVRHGDVVSHPASAADLNVTQVTSNSNVARGSITSDAGRYILAQQNLTVTGWPSDGTEAFRVHFTVVDDSLAEPAESYYLQVITDRPGAVGEVPGDGTRISASDAATITVEAIRGTDTDGDESDGSWQEAAPTANDNPLRFRLVISGNRPQEDARITWAVTQDSDGSNGDVSGGDFLQCVNTPGRPGYDSGRGACSSIRRAGILPAGAARVNADLAAQSTGPWHINLPFLLNDDGVEETAEDFTIDVGGAAPGNTGGTVGFNATLTDVDFTIAASTAEARLIVGVGDAVCAAAGSACRDSGDLDTSGAVPAVNDRGVIRGGSNYLGNAQSDYTIVFPVTFYTPDGDDAGDDPDPLVQGHNATVTGRVTVNYRIGGTIFESGRATGGTEPGSGTADLSTYPRTGSQGWNPGVVIGSYDSTINPSIRVRLPLASITSPTDPSTFTVTITSVSMAPPRGGGEAGVTEIGPNTQGQVQVRRSGGLFFIAAANNAVAAANRVAESAGQLTYNVRFYSASQTVPAGGITIDWALSHGVAERDSICNECPEDTGDTVNADFTGLTSGSLSFASGDPSGTTQTITITLNDDALSENAESFSLTLSNLQVGGSPHTGNLWTFGRSIYTTTIDPNDTYIFTLDCPATVREDAGTLTCSVTHSGTELTEGTTIGWNVGAPNASYTATPADFRPESQRQSARGNTFPISNRDGLPLQFTAGTGATHTFTIPIIDDSDAEEDERFVVALQAPQAGSPAVELTNVRLVDNNADVTILSSDAALTVTCSAAAGLSDLTEGTATTVANCQQTTGSALAGDVEVTWALYDSHGITAATAGTATAATDFTANSGTLTLPTGTASGASVALEITAADDGQAESAEEFSLVITEAGGARYADATVGHNQDLTVAASQAADVLQFEVAVASSVSDVNQVDAGTQVDENVGTVAFTVSLVATRGTPPAPSSNVTVDWAASGVSTADDLTGYPAARTLTFTPSNYTTAQTVTLTVNDDSVNEATEGLIVTLSNSSGGGTPPPIGTASATIQIQDNDLLTFTVARKTPASGAIAEGGSQVFSVTPSGGSIASGTTVTVAWAVQADSDSNTTDAAAGDFRATGDVSDTTALASFPSSGATPLSFTGQTAQDITVWTLDDSTLEGEETFQLALGAISGADGATATADSPLSAQIAVSDAPVFSISATTGGSFPSVNREGGIHAFEVVGSGATPGGAITLRATVSSDEAEIGDFRDSGQVVPATQFTVGDLSFNASNYTTAQAFEVFSINDSAVEGTENFTVTLTVVSGAAALGTATAQGAILFSDFQVGFASTTYSVAEGEVLGNDGVLASGETVEVCVAVTTPDSTTNFPAGVAFSLAASTLAGTAVAADYVAITNQVLGPFNDSTRQACFDVATAHDVLNEGAEAFALDLSSPPGVTLHAQSVRVIPSRATLTIPANDPLLVGVTADQTQTAEGGTASFTLAFVGATLTSDDTTQTQTVIHTPTAATTVTWTLTGTGITPGDFTGITSLTTGNSTTLAHPTPDYGIDIVVAEESMQDPDDVPETFTLTVTGGTAPGGVQAASTGAAANVEIVAAGTFDPTLTLTVGNSTFTEGSAASNAGFTVTLSNAELNGDGSDTVEVTWTVTHITTNAADFTSTSGTAEIDDDESVGTTTTFNVPIAADDLNEGAESFSVQIRVSDTGTTTGGIRIGNAPITITLNDEAADATAVTVARDSGTQSSVSESASADFTVTLSGGIRTGAITVPVSFSGLEDGEYDITAPTGDYDNDPGTPDSAPPAAATGLTLVFPGPSPTVTPTATDSITVSVNLIGDTLNEASETLTLTGAAASATGLRIAVGSVSYATNGDTDNVSVTDDDPISVSIAIDTTATPDDDNDAAGHQRQEGTAAAFTVTLSTASAADATIPYTISGADTDDYTDQTATLDASTSTNGQLVIPAGSTTGTITLNLEEDADADLSETLTVTLTAPVVGPPEVVGPTLGAAGGTIALSTTPAQRSAAINIIPLADMRTLTVMGAATHAETDGDTVVTYTVNLAGTAFTNPTEVSWAVTLGTGTEAADFSSADPPVAPSGSITFPTQTTFQVTIIGDNVNEADEVFTVQVSVADSDADGGTAIGSARSTTIEDDDDMTYSIAADSATVDEEAASAAAAYTLTLSGADSSEGDVTIPYTLGGSASGGGTDYTDPSPLSVTVSAGDTTADLNIAIVGDNFAERGETISVTLGATPTVGAGGGEFALTDTTANQSATVTISPSDLLTVTIGRASGQSGNIAENGGSASFTIALTGTTEGPVDVPFNVGGTGITAADYDISSPTSDPGDTSAIPQLFAGTDSSTNVAIRATDDSAFEGPETLTVTINLSAITAAVGAVSVAAGGSGTASVIIDDDEGVTVNIAAATNASVAEGNSFSITATPTTPHDQPIRLTAAITSTDASGDNDAEDADYGTPSGVTIAANAASSDITIAAAADDLNEGDETFVVTVTGVTTAAAGGSDIPVAITGTAAQTLTVQDNSTDTITVNIALAEGPPAQAASVDEAAEVRFTVSLDGGTRTQNLVVPFQVSGPGGTRVLEDGEFDITMPAGITADATGGELTFPAATAGTVRNLDIVLDLVGDSLNEAAEEVTISLTAPGASGLRHSGGRAGAIGLRGVAADTDLVSAAVSVTDDDDITYSITAPAALEEGDTGTQTMSFTVSLSGASAGDVTIPYSLSDSTARGGASSDAMRDYDYPADYDPDADDGSGRGGVRIPAGDTSAMLSFVVLGDARPESDEDIIVELGATPTVGAAGGVVTRDATEANYRAAGTISDNDATHFFSLSCPDPADGSMTVTLTEAASGAGPMCTATYESPGANLVLNADANLTWTVDHTGGAITTSAADFAGALTGTVTIPIGSTGDGSAGNSVEFALPRAVADSVSEAAETFTVSLSVTSGSTLPTAGSENAATNIAGGTAMPTIAASDPLTVSIGNVSASEMDDNNVVNFPVTFSPGGVSFEGNLALAYRTIAGSSALTGGDYSLDTSPLSIAGASVQSGSYEQPITVRADNLNEGEETLTVRLLSATLASANIAPLDADENAAARNGVLTIAANDPTTVSIAAAAAMAAEGTAAEFTVTLGGGETTADVTLAYSFAIATQTNTGEANGNDNPDATDPGSGSITIDAGESSGTITINISPDGLEEAAETLVVTLGALSGGGGGGISGTGDAQVTIPANAAALHVVTVSGPDSGVAEGGSAVFTFSLPAVPGDNARNAELTAEYTVSGTRVESGDYTDPGSGQVTFPIGTETQTVTIAITDDDLNESAETLTVALTGIVGATDPLLAVGGSAASGSATVEIAASDPLNVTLQRTDSGGITEGGSASFQFVVLLARLSADATIPYTISGTGITAADVTGNAASGLAADSLAGSVTVAASSSTSTSTNSATIRFTAADDALNEATETFAIAIGTPTLAAGGGAISAVQPDNAANREVAIADNDDLTLAVSGPASVGEGSTAEFTVTLTGAADGSAGTLTVAYSVMVGNSQNMAAGVEANSGSAPDITLLDANGNAVDAEGTGANGMASGTLTIAAGEITASIQLRANFDNLNEAGTDADNPLPDETVTLTLTGVTPQADVAGAAMPASAPGNAHTTNIENVNAARTLAVSAPPSVMEGGAIAFEISLIGAAPVTSFPVTWALEGDGAQLQAASGSGLARNHGGPHQPGDPDISGPLTGTVTFAAGSTASQMVTVPVRQDPLNEGTEALRLRLTAPPTDAGGRPQNFPTTAPATQVSVPAGRTEIPPSDPIVLALQRPAGQSGAQTGDDFGFAVSFGCADGTSVSLGNCEPVVPSTAVTIPYTYRVGATDYPGTLMVAAGQTAEQLNAAAAGGTPVTPPADAMAALMSPTMVQTVTVSLGTPQVTPPANAPTGATPPVARTFDVVTNMEDRAEQMAIERAAEVARREGRPAPPETLTEATVQVGAFSAALDSRRIEAPEGTTAAFTVTIGVASGALTGTLTIPWEITLAAPSFAPNRDDGSAAAAAEDADFAGGTAPGGTLTFSASALTQTISIPIATDDLDEVGGEYFQVTLGAPSGTDAGNVAVDRTPAVVLIPSLRATLSVADVTVAEGAEAVFELDLTDFVGGSATTQPLTVHYILEDDTARRGDQAGQGADYVAPLRGSVVIPAGETEAEIRIPVVQDGVLEPTETFRLRFTVTADGDPPADGGRISGGGGLIIFTAEEGTATATIRDDADQANRRTQRVAAMVAALDRQTAELATDAITDRFQRAPGAGTQTALSIAGRDLIGGSGAAAAGKENDLGLALFGAAGLGGAGLGVSGAAGTGGAGTGDAFGGLGAGLSGGANVWRGQDLPSLAEALSGTRFSFSAAGWADIANIADGLEIWGRGGTADLKGSLAGSNGTLRYKGDSIAVFVGADRPVRDDMLAGLALGYSVGDLSFTDTAGTPSSRFELSGSVDTNMLSLHPYFSWWITPEVNTWLALGYGQGSVDLEEQDAGRTRTLPGTADSSMWMLAAGVSGRVRVTPATHLKLSFELSRVGSEVDAAAFDDGARLNNVRARSLRVGGEAEVSRNFALPGGFALRPFATGRLRFESGGQAAVHGVGNRDAAFDLGGGVSAAKPDWGLDAQLEFSDQLNSSGQEEQRLSLDLSYDLAGDKQGLTMSVQTAFSERRSGSAAHQNGNGNGLWGFGNAANNLGLGSGSFGALSGGSAEQSIAGEIGYGVSFRQLGRAGLLTPYGRFDLRQSDSRWAAGLRLAETGGGLRLGLEGGLDLRSGLGAAARDFDLTLTGQLRF